MKRRLATLLITTALLIGVPAGSALAADCHWKHWGDAYRHVCMK